MDYFDKQVKQVLDQLEAAPWPSPRDIPIEELRTMFSGLWQSVAPPSRPMHKTEDIRIPGPAGDVPCKLYVPRKADGPLPALVYYHGGGCCILTPGDYEGVITTLASEADCVVVAPDFRKAPEHPFPAALEDSYAALAWLQENADEVGGDPERIAIAGDSGGGYLTCAVPHEARRLGTPQPILQIPIYPLTDQAPKTESRRDLDPFVNELATYLMAELYAGGDALDPRCSPLRAMEFSELAPAYIITAGLDPLRDEGYAYATKLRQAGVSVFYHCYEHMIHGFLSMGGVIDVGNLAIQHVAGALRNAYRNHAPGKADRK